MKASDQPLGEGSKTCSAFEMEIFKDHLPEKRFPSIGITELQHPFESLVQTRSVIYELLSSVAVFFFLVKFFLRTKPVIFTAFERSKTLEPR